MSDLVGNPEDRFSRVVAQMVVLITSKKLPKMEIQSKSHNTLETWVESIDKKHTKRIHDYLYLINKYHMIEIYCITKIKFQQNQLS